MALKGLKTSIAAHLAVLFLLAMVLLDFILLIVTQETLIQSEIARGRQLLAVIEGVVASSSVDLPVWQQRQKLQRILEHAGIPCMAIHQADLQTTWSLGTFCGGGEELRNAARDAATKGREAIDYHGQTFGIFWRERGYVQLSAPLRLPHQEQGGASLQLSLHSVYEMLRRTQHIALIYILINTGLLTFLGLYRLNTITVKPVQRLLNRAQEFEKLDDGSFFMDETEDNEYSRLSKSLNRMLMRIAQDKQKLQDTIRSLEEANQTLARTQQEMVRTEKLATVGRLSAGIAHEIGNPIGIVKGYLVLLQDSAIPEEDKRDFIRRTEEEVERINSIIRQLLDFSRPSKGGSEEVAVHGILEEIGNVCRCQPMLACMDLHFELRAPRDRVWADPSQLRQVFLNLIINSADAMGAGKPGTDGRLVIRTSIVKAHTGNPPRRQAMLQIEFQDDGPGIPTEQIGNVFDPFFTTKEPGKGTGLGLWVSFSIVEYFGGSLRAVNRPLGGLSMVVELPLVSDETADGRAGRYPSA